MAFTLEYFANIYGMRIEERPEAITPSSNSIAAPQSSRRCCTSPSRPMPLSLRSTCLSTFLVLPSNTGWVVVGEDEVGALSCSDTRIKGPANGGPTLFALASSSFRRILRPHLFVWQV